MIRLLVDASVPAEQRVLFVYIRLLAIFTDVM